MGIMSPAIMQHSEDAPARIPPASGRIARLIWSAAGTIFLSLGIVGIAVPLLPTTPFLLLAASCYLKGSPRMYRWMMTNRHFGQYLADYRAGRGVPLQVKVGAISLLWGMIILTAILATSNTIVRIGLFVVAVAVTLHVSTLKTKKEPSPERRHTD